MNLHLRITPKQKAFLDAAEQEVLFMTATKILSEEINDLKVASLPSRPTAPSAFGGRGFTATQMKEAFDRLPLLIVDRFNRLLDDVSASGSSSLAARIPTGIAENHSLSRLFSDILDGSFAGYLKVGDRSLLALANAITDEIAELLRRSADLAASLTVNPDDEVFSSADPIVLTHAHDYRAGAVSALSFALPADPVQDFFCSLSFDTTETPATVTFPADPVILFGGDHISEGIFVPRANQHYTLLFWYDGRWEASVRGVALA